MNIGSRVISNRGELGIVEEIDNDFTTIRYLTPDNNSSCCCGTFWTKDLRLVGDNVIPMPKSDEWWDKARDFYNFVTGIIETEICEEK